MSKDTVLSVMGKITGLESVFPIADESDGLTLRGFYAAIAMAAAIAAGSAGEPETVARTAVQYADALLSELER